jgi:putative copper resistance protein D
MALLAATLLRLGPNRSGPLFRPFLIVAGVLAAALVGTVAWAGHAAANMGSDLKGNVHLSGDVLHLIAAAAWIGALVPLALLLKASMADSNSLKIARAATIRFSTVGTVSVATILVTGLINTWVLAGSVHALTTTDYGHLLIVKVVLFLCMLCVACINRFQLTPQLVEDGPTETTRSAASRLRRNAIVEVIIGLLILIIVALLGTMSPGLKDMAMGKAGAFSALSE